jgi:hypothetical protein
VDATYSGNDTFSEISDNSVPESTPTDSPSAEGQQDLPRITALLDSISPFMDPRSEVHNVFMRPGQQTQWEALERQAREEQDIQDAQNANHAAVGLDCSASAAAYGCFAGPGRDRRGSADQQPGAQS